MTEHEICTVAHLERFAKEHGVIVIDLYATYLNIYAAGVALAK